MNQLSFKNYLTSDCFNASIYGHQKLHHPISHDVFTHVKRTEEHLNGDDFINTLSSNNGIWSLYSETSSDFYPGGALNGKCENHYYVSFDKSKVVGFVRNRTWNFMTDNQSEPCYEIIENNDFHNFDIRTWQDNDFKLTNLLGNHNYRIDYYTLNNYISSGYNDCFDTQNDGEKNLEHPILSYFEFPNGQSWIPIYWYVAWVDDCMNGMALQDENDNPSNMDQLNRKATQINNFEEKNKIETSIIIHPNPVLNEFTISLNNEINLNIEKTFLLDNYGQKINLELTLNKTINISTLANGVYHLHIENNSISYYLKIVKI